MDSNEMAARLDGLKAHCEALKQIEDNCYDLWDGYIEAVDAVMNENAQLKEMLNIEQEVLENA